MQTPHITIEQVSVLYTNAEAMLKLSNQLIDKHNAREEQTNEKPLITAEEAKKRALQDVDFYHVDEGWVSPNALHIYSDNRKYRLAWHIKHPAIKQPEPVVQATVLRSDFDFVMQDKQRCVKLIEEVYALLADDKSIEAKEILQKRVNNMIVNIPVFIEPVEPNCQVRNDDTGELKTMTPEAAKLLQAELGDTVQWWLGSTNMSEWKTLDFNSTGLYSYKLKVKPPRRTEPPYLMRK